MQPRASTHIQSFSSGMRFLIMMWTVYKILRPEASLAWWWQNEIFRSLRTNSKQHWTFVRWYTITNEHGENERIIWCMWGLIYVVFLDSSSVSQGHGLMCMSWIYVLGTVIYCLTCRTYAAWNSSELCHKFVSLSFTNIKQHQILIKSM